MRGYPGSDGGASRIDGDGIGGGVGVGVFGRGEHLGEGEGVCEGRRERSADQTAYFLTKRLAWC